jgi:zinc protease
MLLAFANSNASPTKCAGASFEKLENGISVVFVDTEPSDFLLIMLCVSSGSGDDVDKRGVANLLRYMFARKLKERSDSDSIQYGSESNSYTGHDQSVYYFYGRRENLEGFIKNLGTIFSNFKPTTNDFNESKAAIEQQIEEDRKVDKNVVRYEARKSLYWHSNYGIEPAGDIDDLKAASEEDVENFKKKNYTKNRVTIIVAGRIDKNLARGAIVQHFGKEKTESKINRLQEPPHHGSTVKISKNSSQTNVAVVEMHWRVPNYRTDKKKALATEIFVEHLEKTLKKRLIEEQKVVASIAFARSFWNYEYGDLRITITLNNSASLKNAVNAVLSEIKCIAADNMTAGQAKEAAERLAASSDWFSSNADLFDFIDLISQRISSGYDLDFLKSHKDFVMKFDLDEINAQAKEIFTKDPCVISIIRPIQ